MKNTGGNQGFTLVELMIVVAIVAFLSMIAVPNFVRFLSKAKRAEAYMNLGSLYVAQKAYWAEHGSYATALTGKDGLGWKPEGTHNYTYGFNAGSEGVHYFTGSLHAPSSELAGTKADKQSFLIAAVADIDNDGSYDLLTVNELNVITIVKDDLQ